MLQQSSRVNIQSGSKAGSLRTKKLHLQRLILQYTRNTVELIDCFEFKVTITQQFWLAKYASMNTSTSAFSTKYMTDVPDVNVKIQARNGSYTHVYFIPAKM